MIHSLLIDGLLLGHDDPGFFTHTLPVRYLLLKLADGSSCLTELRCGLLRQAILLNAKGCVGLGSGGKLRHGGCHGVTSLVE